jgi:PPM family protein phosphatase
MVGMLSDIGNLRSVNEDYVDYFEDEDLRLYIIADGMGGHNAGEVASKLAVESTISFIKLRSDIINIEELLVKAIKFANKRIYEMAEKNNMLRGMGTTITACIIKGCNMVTANVGDSSCFVIDKNEIKKITKDHSYVQELLDRGTITEEQAVNHPNKNIITRALGTDLTVQIDTFKIDISNIKKVIMCTDGLSNSISQKEIYDILLINKNDNSNACRELVKLCKTKEGKDNISVIVFEGEC